MDPIMIWNKLEKLHFEGVSWDDIVHIELKLKSYFVKEPLEDVVKLATDIYHTFNDDEIENLLWKMLQKKEFVFKESFNKLTA